MPIDWEEWCLHWEANHYNHKTPDQLGKHHTYSTPLGSLPWLAAWDYHGNVIPLTYMAYANPVLRAIMAMPRDGKWYMVSGSGRWSRMRRKKIYNRIQRWFRNQGYPRKHPDVTPRFRWIGPGLSVRWRAVQRTGD